MWRQLHLSRSLEKVCSCLPEGQVEKCPQGQRDGKGEAVVARAQENHNQIGLAKQSASEVVVRAKKSGSQRNPPDVVRSSRRKDRGKRARCRGPPAQVPHVRRKCRHRGSATMKCRAASVPFQAKGQAQGPSSSWADTPARQVQDRT